MAGNLDQLMQNAMPRALFITLSNIGDAILTTPTLQVLHEAFQNHCIDIVADPRSAELFQHCPYRGEVFLLHKRRGLMGRVALVRQLRRRQYDVIVDLRTEVLAYLLRAGRRYTRLGAQRASGHAVERHLAVIRPLLQGPPPETRVWLNADDLAQAGRMLARLPGKRWLTVAPGANWPGKIWPLAYFQELLARLRDQFDAVIVCGGPKDFGLAATLTRSSPLPAVNLASDTSLLRAAAVLERAAYFVGNDSGLGHLAAAVGTPTLTLFGPGDPERYHPWGAKAQWVCAPEQDLKRLTPETVATRIISCCQQ
jgi:ADP-heptose:LPS heptosyltransferase